MQPRQHVEQVVAVEVAAAQQLALGVAHQRVEGAIVAGFHAPGQWPVALLEHQLQQRPSGCCQPVPGLHVAALEQSSLWPSALP